MFNLKTRSNCAGAESLEFLTHFHIFTQHHSNPAGLFSQLRIQDRGAAVRVLANIIRPYYVDLLLLLPIHFKNCAGENCYWLFLPLLLSKLLLPTYFNVHLSMCLSFS